MPHHDDGGCVEWFLKILVGEDANVWSFRDGGGGYEWMMIRAEREREGGESIVR